MVWVPVLYICLTAGFCAFKQGEPTYSELGCQEQITQAAVILQQDPRVAVFDSACIKVSSA